MRTTRPLLLALPLLLCAAPALSALSAEELAKLAQNPVGNLISVPLQNNTNFNTGPLSGPQNILNIQPVVPVEVDKDWNLITRTIVPVIWQPEFVSVQGDTFGLGDREHVARRLLQRAASRQRCELADAAASTFHVPEMTHHNKGDTA